MISASNDIEFYRGDTVTYRWSFFTEDEYGNQTPIDVSGHTLWFTAKVNQTDPDSAAVAQVSTVLPSTTDTQAGIGSITLSSTDTDLTPGQYYYDCQWTQPSSPPVVHTLMSGMLTVLQDVTITN